VKTVDSPLRSHLAQIVCDRISDLGPATVRGLGRVPKSLQAEPGGIRRRDLEEVIEVAVPSGRATLVASRIEKAFNVLGEYELETGIAYAVATPPFEVREETSQKTFAILVTSRCDLSM